MLDLERIRQLVDMMVANDLTEISLRDGDVEVNLRRPTGNMVEAVPSVGGNSPALNPDAGTSAASSAESAAKEDEENGEVEEIKSPMVGTFYAAPDPDSPPFVQVGSRVNQSTVVCIVEAMKVFNEIKAEVTGTIEKVLAKNEQPVEYGEPMFLVRPD